MLDDAPPTVGGARAFPLQHKWFRASVELGTTPYKYDSGLVTNLTRTSGKSCSRSVTL